MPLAEHLKPFIVFLCLKGETQLWDQQLSRDVDQGQDGPGRESKQLPGTLIITMMGSEREAERYRDGTGGRTVSS